MRGTACMVHSDLLQHGNRALALLQKGICSRKSNDTGTDNCDVLLTDHVQISHKGCSHNADYTRSFSSCQSNMLFCAYLLHYFNNVALFRCVCTNTTTLLFPVCKANFVKPEQSLDNKSAPV